jgi:hypothetical protein
VLGQRPKRTKWEGREMSEPLRGLPYQEAETGIAGLRTDMEAVRVRLGQVEQERDAAIERADAEEQARVEAERRAAAAESRAKFAERDAARAGAERERRHGSNT